MDGFFKKLTKKVNLERRPTPDARLPGHCYFKGCIFKKKTQKNVQKGNSYKLQWISTCLLARKTFAGSSTNYMYNYHSEYRDRQARANRVDPDQTVQSGI